MAFRFFNPNPDRNLVGDCVIRAVSKVTDQDWDTTFCDITVCAFAMKDMPSSNAVWSNYLHSKGFNRYIIPNTCPDCYTVKDFCTDNPIGEYLLALGTHVIAVQDGDYFDTWDSGNEVPIYYWKKER